MSESREWVAAVRTGRCCRRFPRNIFIRRQIKLPDRRRWGLAFPRSSECGQVRVAFVRWLFAVSSRFVFHCAIFAKGRRNYADNSRFGLRVMSWNGARNAAAISPQSRPGRLRRGRSVAGRPARRVTTNRATNINRVDQHTSDVNQQYSHGGTRAADSDDDGREAQEAFARQNRDPATVGLSVRLGLFNFE